MKEIEVGTRIIYVSDLAFPQLDTDIVLDLPGPENNKAFGHCTLDLVTSLGRCTLSGGTGKFTHIRMSEGHATAGEQRRGLGLGRTYSFIPRD